MAACLLSTARLPVVVCRQGLVRCLGLRPTPVSSPCIASVFVTARHLSSEPADGTKFFSEAEHKQFRRDGYIRGNYNFLSAEERENIVQWAAEMRDWPEKKGSWMKYFETAPDGTNILCRIENFLPYHALSRGLVRGKITQAISELMGEESILYKEKINFKLPGAKGFPPHQDAPAYITFGMDYHVTCMIAADAATMDNGCLEVVPHGPELGMLPHPGGCLPQEMVDEWDRNNKWVPITCESGEVVFFNSLVPHRSRDNMSSTASRSIYYLTYNRLRDGDHRDNYYADKRKRFPPANEQEEGKDYSDGAAIYNLATPIPVKSKASASS